VSALVESYSLVEDALKGSVFNTDLEPYEISVPPPRNKNIYSVDTTVPNKKPSLFEPNEPKKLEDFIGDIVEGFNPPAYMGIDWSFDLSKTILYSVGVDLISYEMEQAARELPGMNQQVYCPVSCDVSWTLVTSSLKSTIIHLNDYHRWSRDDIADWLDELADAGIIDIDFPTPE
jgi:hypothetical protein